VRHTKQGLWRNPGAFVFGMSFIDGARGPGLPRPRFSRLKSAAHTLVHLQLAEILVGACARLAAGKVIATLSITHRPISDAHRRPEDRGDSKAAAQFTAVDRL